MNILKILLNRLYGLVRFTMKELKLKGKQD